MSMINKEISDFKTYAFHNLDFKMVSKEDILGKWNTYLYAEEVCVIIMSKDYEK